MPMDAGPGSAFRFASVAGGRGPPKAAPFPPFNPPPRPRPAGKRGAGGGGRRGAPRGRASDWPPEGMTRTAHAAFEHEEKGATAPGKSATVDASGDGSEHDP